VCRIEPERTAPFWALTRYEDVVWVSRQPRRFVSSKRLVVNPDNPPSEAGGDVHMLINMDPPEHGAFRRLASGFFTPRALARLESRIHAIADEILDGIADRGGARECDFVSEVAAKLPLAVIAELLGVPREDWPLLVRWSDQVVGNADPEYQRGGTAGETLERAQFALFEYFALLAEERRARPKDDLVSLLARAEIDGRRLSTHDLLSYFFLLVAAGNETTRNAASGGLMALLESPDELARLQRDPSLLPGAVEEILRWTSPIVHFCRTATEDVELRGVRIRAGESIAMFYPSANRDESVFDDAQRFRIDREPNPHLAFGIGEHFCLGAHLARMELRGLFAQLLARMTDGEIVGPVSRLRSATVGGFKALPVRLRVRARATGAA
jgi:cytochrome P450